MSVQDTLNKLRSKPANKEVAKKSAADFEDPNATGNVREQYFRKLGFTGSNDVITAEKRMANAPYADPVTLNFKLIIDWDKPYGLFADEENVDSALAYLKRIGEDARYEALKVFIDKFHSFIVDYDFLILNCDGLGEAVNRKPWEIPNEQEDKIIFTVRDTVDLRIQALLTSYRNIWFDDYRMVEVLPANLRRFDFYVLVYSSGYYSMMLYDSINPEAYNMPRAQRKREGLGEFDTDITHKIFPTIKKLSNIDSISTLPNEIPFNHVLIMFQDGQINNEESGKSFFSELTNEMSSDYVKNTLALSYRFSNYDGIFHNTFGSVALASMFVLAAEASTEKNKQNYFQKLKNAGIQAGKDIWNGVKTQTLTSLKGAISSATPIGNALDMLVDPSKLVGSLQNAVEAGITNLKDTYIDGTISKLQNLLSRNFSDHILTDLVLDKLDKLTKKKNPKNPDWNIPNDTQKVSTNMDALPEPPKRDFSSGEKYNPEGLGPIPPSIKYGEGNGYPLNDNSRYRGIRLITEEESNAFRNRNSF